MSYKKLSARRLADINGPRRKKPPIREQNREVAELVRAEHEVLQLLVEDANIRAGFLRGKGSSFDPLAVWTDFDQTYLFTQTDPTHLQAWAALSEYMKLQLGFLMAMAFGGYSFTVNLHPDLEAKWIAAGMDVNRNIQRRCRRELDARGLRDLPYAYAIEARTGTTRSRTHLHLHGYFLAEDRLTATKFKLTMERALLGGDLVRARRSRSINITPVYDMASGARGSGRWVSYFLKGVHLWDRRIRGRRVFMSRPLTQTARGFWELLGTDPFTVSR